MALRKIIESMLSNKRFAQYSLSMELVYNLFVKEAKAKGYKDIPSYKTVTRFIRYLKSAPLSKYTQ